MSDRSLTAYLAGTKTLRRYLKPDCSVRGAEVFLYVAEFEPVTLEDVTRGVRAPKGTIYDDLKALGKRDANGKAGCLLVHEISNAQGGAHTFTLSGRGRMAIEAMECRMALAMIPEDEDELEAYFEAKRVTRG